MSLVLLCSRTYNLKQLLPRFMNLAWCTRSGFLAKIGLWMFPDDTALHHLLCLSHRHRTDICSIGLNLHVTNEKASQKASNLALASSALATLWQRNCPFGPNTKTYKFFWKMSWFRQHLFEPVWTPLMHPLSPISSHTFKIKKTFYLGCPDFWENMDTLGVKYPVLSSLRCL